MPADIPHYTRSQLTEVTVLDAGCRCTICGIRWMNYAYVIHQRGAKLVNGMAGEVVCANCIDRAIKLTRALNRVGDDNLTHADSWTTEEAAACQ